MQIEIHFNGLAKSEALVEKIHQEVQNAVRHCRRQVTRVQVHLGDLNAAKAGAADKRCLMEARPAGQQPLAVESQGEDLYRVVRTAAAKLERALKRRVERNDHKGS